MSWGFLCWQRGHDIEMFTAYWDRKATPWEDGKDFGWACRRCGHSWFASSQVKSVEWLRENGYITSP